MSQLLLAVFVGGGTGSVLRWWLGMKFNPMHHAIPIGTLAANLLGAFIIGAGLAWFNRLTNIDPMWKLLITTGFCGGLTTFLNLLIGGRFPAATGPFQLGAAEHSGQSVRFIRHDGNGILALFPRCQPLTADKKKPALSGFLYSTDAMLR